ncbi:MAG: hypothetical protein NDJ90_09660 [Oligoflexia bacterium]|nr:hypothetical protein [Oligoflexia bacterium]
MAALLGASEARCDDVYTVVVKKQEAKAQRRWSLAEWLETKEKIKLMDMWLALHTPSPFEFALSGDYRTGSGPGGNFTGWSASALAFATIFGLEAQFERAPQSRYHGLFHFRILGYSDQGTHITLQGGLRGIGGHRAPLAGVRTSLYLARFFGIEGLYRHYFESAGPERRYEAGAFIDFRYLRVYGGAYFEPLPVRSSGATLGTRFYF